VFTAPTVTTSDNFDGPSSSCPGDFNAGTGWGGAWTRNGSANDIPTYQTTNSPNDTSCHVRIRGNGWMCRSFSLSGTTTAELRYSAKYNSWETTAPADDALVRISTASCTTGLTTLRTHTTSNTSTSHSDFSSNLDAYAGSATVYLRIAGSMTDEGTLDDFWVDSFDIESGSSGSSNGYLNGNDGSSPTTCVSQTNTPRERQIDVRTLRLAREMKLNQDVEIFVVAFAGGIAGCNLDNTTVYDDENAAHCNAVNDGTPGPIGNNTNEGTANHRLLKCIASSSQGTLDHYHFAETEDDLQAIFTKIANQIAHRLIE